jgi:uncharacterized membrane protein YuzA (DUF378 family)
MNKSSSQIILYKFLILLVLIGSINWGLVGLFNFDLVKSFGSLFGKNMQEHVSVFIYILVATAAILLIIQRDTFLPFLGHTVMPKPLNDYNPSGDVITKTIENLPPNVKVIYWAALSIDDLYNPLESYAYDKTNNPYDAYGEYTNQGVTTSDANGVAILKVKNPVSYEVPFKGRLKQHIHYRYWTSPGMASRLFTIKI